MEVRLGVGPSVRIARCLVGDASVREYGLAVNGDHALLGLVSIVGTYVRKAFAHNVLSDFKQAFAIGAIDIVPISGTIPVTVGDVDAE